jgi:hypothetical protein
LFLQKSIGMRIARRPLQLAGLLSAVVACRPVQNVKVPIDARLSTQHAELVRADSEVFAAVVRIQLAAPAQAFPYQLEGLRYDSRPYSPGGPRPRDADSIFVLPDLVTVEQLAKMRAEILATRGIAEGRRVYRPCPGILTTPPPAGAPDSSSGRYASRSHCPSGSEHHLMVSLPVRGFPAHLKMLRDRQTPRSPPLSGEVWTVFVETYGVGKSGSMETEVAWVLMRDPPTHRLELADTYLRFVAE